MRSRPSVGEQRTSGDVRPVTGRTLVVVSACVVLFVLVAIGAVLLASS